LSNLHCHEHCGIIPACAGSTQAADHSTTTGEDHPRLRGEHRRRQPMPARLRGSSPPARGAPQHDLGLHPVGRIIPACAGSTWPSKWSTGSARDHPRLRGEHLAKQMVDWIGQGSSPPARGAHDCGWDALIDRRIIPACAGSTPITIDA